MKHLFKPIFLLLVLSLSAWLLAGCGGKSFKPGETIEIKKQFVFFLAPIPSEDTLALARQTLPGKSEAYILEIAALSEDQYFPIPAGVLPSLAEDATWEASMGFLVSNPQVTVNPQAITWIITFGNSETTTHYEGILVTLTANLTAPSEPGEGKLTLNVHLPNMDLLTTSGILIGQDLTFVNPLWDSKGVVTIKSSMDRQAYFMPITLELRDQDTQIKP